MAGDWIKLETVTPDKPEVFQIATMLGISPEEVVGRLIRIWIWADQQSRDGGNLGINDDSLDSIARKSGFAVAMRAVGWLDDKGIPNFQRHNGAPAKQRASGQQRTAKHRAGRSGNDLVTDEQREPVTIPRPIRMQILERDHRICVYCGRREGEYSIGETSRDAVLSLDHVIPQIAGGASTLMNLVTACMACNRHKHGHTPEEVDLPWPVDVTGKRYGSVTKSLPEKRREEKIKESKSHSRKRDREPDPRQSHPAIQAFRDVVKSYPPKPVWDELIETVGESPDSARMSHAFAEWLKVGFKPTNLAWLFDWYVNGIPKNGSGNGGTYVKPSYSERQSAAIRNALATIGIRADGHADATRIERGLPPAGAGRGGTGPNTG